MGDTALTVHEYAPFAAMGAIAGITALALVLGAADGLLAAAITALATLGVAGYAQRRRST